MLKAKNICLNALQSWRVLQDPNFWINLWSIDYKDGENREATIRLTLKKLFFYLVFLTIATTVLLEMVPPLVYTFTTIVRGQFVDISFTSSGRKGPIKFEDILDRADFWVYLLGVAIPNMYSTKWYNDFDPVASTSEDDTKFLYENSLLGVPRLRELKINSENCSNTYDGIKPLLDLCYPTYSKYTECKKNLKIPANAPKHITIFKYAEPWYPFKYYGSVSTYDSGGYIQNLDKDVNKSLETASYLYHIWNFNRTTRAVFLEFTFYNANLNIFCICKLVFEVPASGGFITSSSFQTIKLLRYKDSHDFAIMGLEFVYVVYIIYFIRQEILNIKYYKLRYLKFFWTYINLLIIIGSLLLIPFNAYKFFIIPEKIKELDENPNQFADMDLIVFWQLFTNNLEGLLLFILWIKIFRFLNISKTMGQLSATLRRCGKDMFGFSIMFFITFFGFAQMGYLLFGEQVDYFSTFGKSLMTLLMTILGDFDYYAIEEHNKILAPIFFVTYILLVFFILFNMFLAIITDTFIDVKDDLKANRSELELSEFLLRLPRNFALIYLPRFATRKQKTLKLSGNEMISKMRKLLELCNFSNFDIKLFFQMYSINENNEIDDKLIVNMLQEIKKYKLKTDDDIQESENKLSYDLFLRLPERIDYLKIRLDKFEEKLNQFIIAYEQFKIKEQTVESGIDK